MQKITDSYRNIRYNESCEVPAASWDHNIAVQENVAFPMWALQLCHYKMSAHNAFYVEYQSLESLIHHVSMCLSCRDSKIRDVTH